MGFFTDQEQDSVKIKRWILHVVGGKAFDAMPERKPEHSEFFLTKILETAADPIFSFKTTSTTRKEIEAIATGVETFERGAQSLARNFNGQHVGGSADGVLCMFELSVSDSQTKIYSLIKYDYRMALEQDGDKPEAALRRIVTALIDDNKAVQKTALVRVVGGVAEPEVSAKDRKKLAPDLADYFAKFLGVDRAISNEELSRKAREILRRALKACKADLPGEDVPKAFKAAQATLGRRMKVNEDAIVEAVLFAAGDPQDDKIRKHLERETRRRVKDSKLHELEFKPDRTVLRQPSLRKLVTVEGVTITFLDIDNNPNVRVVDQPGGGKQIVIDTKQIKENSLVATPPGQPLK
ncbi:hypothetical protein A9179_11895 [Pseudomonas alcaligenes]|uniref:Nucleoid associated protein NdpA n=1 Tax=Aquipseudomonas alcaligenes TaxID=43263 RepID=A0ABR7S2N2_AQUAC|nr:hypothetical protein [Pseudomonas alcaligenes]MBC9250982.1 hypothetical protein [Pseudomonas alcaligenes]